MSDKNFFSDISLFVVNGIRRSLKTQTITNVANVYNVSRKTVYNIKYNKTHKDVPPPKVLKQFPNYEIYSDGVVVSRKTGKQITTRADRDTPSVRLVDRRSNRRRIILSDLLKKAFKF